MSGIPRTMVDIQLEGKDNFLLQQYQSIREEISRLKDQMLRLQLSSLTVIPIAIAGGIKYDFMAIYLAVPLVTVFCLLLFGYLHLSVMRAGTFIREKLEPCFGLDESQGWEAWLENDKMNRRLAERCLKVGTLIMFTLYFSGGSVLAYMELAQANEQLAGIVLSGYVVLFLLACCGWAYVRRQIKDDKEKDTSRSLWEWIYNLVGRFFKSLSTAASSTAAASRSTRLRASVRPGTTPPSSRKTKQRRRIFTSGSSR